jgi:hypothetical protein
LFHHGVIVRGIDLSARFGFGGYGDDVGHDLSLAEIIYQAKPLLSRCSKKKPPKPCGLGGLISSKKEGFSRPYLSSALS